MSTRPSSEETVDTNSTASTSRAGGAAAGEPPIVEIVDLHKQFGHIHVLQGVYLDIYRGEVVCVLGRSGAGKSTMLRCINHLEKPSHGAVIVNNEVVGYREKSGKLYELRRNDVARQRADTGMVFQSFNLFPHLTVLENLIEAPRRVRKRPHADCVQDALRALDDVGLRAKADVYPSTLSGGQQQRVAIARGLVMAPKVMLFDEPTSALDPELVGDVLEAMRRLAATGMTMIVVTHEIGFARNVADRVVFMAEGKIAEQGTPAQVLDAPQHEATQHFLSNLM